MIMAWKNIFTIILFASSWLLETTTARKTSKKRDPSNFLETYGYFPPDNDTIYSESRFWTLYNGMHSRNIRSPQEISDAVGMFQSYYNLKPSGSVDDETWRLMNRPRCGIKDPIGPLNSLSKTVWDTTNLTWMTPFRDPRLIKLTQRAFDIWEHYSAFTFTQVTDSPDANIYVLMKNTQIHWYHKVVKRYPCYPFSNITLGHAFSPPLNETEIHLNSAHDWYWGFDWNYLAENGTVSFFQVLLHEIGHTLGLEHSNDKEAQMFSMSPIKKPSTALMDLSYLDIQAIRNMYGPPQPLTDEQKKKWKELFPNHTEPVAPYKTDSGDDNNYDDGDYAHAVNDDNKHDYPIYVVPQINEVPPDPEGQEIDLCSLKFVDAAVVVNKKVYIMYKKWFWRKNLESSSFDEPQLLSDFFKFLPKNFTRVQGAYQRPRDHNIVLVVDDLVYVMNWPQLQLKYGFPKNLEFFSISTHINAIFRGAVSTYVGKTYVFYNNDESLQFDEISQLPFEIGKTSKKFPGIFAEPYTVWRWTDGNLYFIDEANNFMAYNEFNMGVMKSGTFSVQLFGVECLSHSVINQLARSFSDNFIEFIGEGDDEQALKLKKKKQKIKKMYQLGKSRWNNKTDL